MRPRNLAHGGGELLASAGRPASTLTQKETPARVAVHLGRTRCNGSTQRRKDTKAQRGATAWALGDGMGRGWQRNYQPRMNATEATGNP